MDWLGMVNRGVVDWGVVSAKTWSNQFIVLIVFDAFSNLQTGG